MPKTIRSSMNPDQIQSIRLLHCLPYLNQSLYRRAVAKIRDRKRD